MTKARRAFTDLLERWKILEADGKYFKYDVAEWEIIKDPDGGWLPWGEWPALVRTMRNLSYKCVLDDCPFLFFAGEEFRNHPWHKHSHNLQKHADSIDDAIAHLHQFCCEVFFISTCCESCRGEREVDFMSDTLTHRGATNHDVKLRDSITDEYVKEGILKFSAALLKNAENIRSMIEPMQGKFYSKSWAVKIAMQRKKFTKQRGDVIKEMIANGRIPKTGTRLLSKLIEFEEKNVFYIDDAWKTVGNNRKKGLTLALVPVKMYWDGLGRMDRRSRFVWQPSISCSFYCPPTQTHLSDYFGLKKQVRLYFSPRQFQTPTELMYGDCCDSFYSLKEYIIDQSKRDGEVCLNGGRRVGRSVTFSCKTKHCKFHFVLKWDKYGYFIDYHNPARDRFFGCVVHNH